ncbi:two-component system sensor kinase FixL [Bradyrhizobium sp. AZCC 1588]
MRQPSFENMSSGRPLVLRMSRWYLAIGLGYLVSYVLLDWISYVHPFATFGITPWNPQTGLSFALILLFGGAYMPWLFAAPLIADLIVRDLPLPPGVELLVVAITGLGYGSAALLLLHRRFGFDRSLSSRSSLLWLVTIAVASIALVSIGHALVLVLHGIIASHDFAQVSLRGFIGDLIGVIVFTPFALIVFTRRSFPVVSWEAAAILILVLVGLWGVFGVTEALRFQLFYVFFVPVVWIAVRFGLEGVTLGLAVIQIGLIAAIELSHESATDVVAYQALMTVLSATGLAIGVLVSEQRRTQHQLRIHQDALHRAWRLATMGEFAAAVAHEINQPLTAIGNYARLAKRAVEKTPPDTAAAATASAEAIVQVDRAGAVVNRLRDFIRLGRIETSPVSVTTLVAEAVAVFGPELERRGIGCQTSVGRDVPPVLADGLQIEQVILNLVRNAAEALAGAGRYDGKIVIEGLTGPNGKVTIRVSDNGPGIDPDLGDDAIAAFATTKPDGLGLGLSLSRSVVEAHGGELRIESTKHGTTASFTLPAVHSSDSGA